MAALLGMFKRKGEVLRRRIRPVVRAIATVVKIRNDGSEKRRAGACGQPAGRVPLSPPQQQTRKCTQFQVRSMARHGKTTPNWSPPLSAPKAITSTPALRFPNPIGLSPFLPPCSVTAVVPLTLSQRRRSTTYKSVFPFHPPRYSKVSDIVLLLILLFPLSLRRQSSQKKKSLHLLFFPLESILLLFFVLSFLFFADVAIKRWCVENGALD